MCLMLSPHKGGGLGWGAARGNLTRHWSGTHSMAYKDFTLETVDTSLGVGLQPLGLIPKSGDNEIVVG